MKNILFIPFLFIAFYMSAAPIGEKKAREIAVQFFSQGSTKATGRSARREFHPLYPERADISLRSW